MEKQEQSQSINWLPALVVALLLGVGLHELFRIWPSIVTEFLSPVNNSIWEHLKVLFWPLLLVELGIFPPAHRSGGLLALLLSCAAMLAAGWVYHLVLGGTELWVDLAIFGLCILAYFLLSDAPRPGKQWLPVLRLLTALLAALMILFTLNPPHGALFVDPARPAIWYERLC